VAVPAARAIRAGYTSTLLPDEYQHPLSAGSLATARRCWTDLLSAGRLQLPHQFQFRFDCPSEPMAAALVDRLRYADYAGMVQAVDQAAPPCDGRWQVAGTTHAKVWSLPILEHLFMGLRAAGPRHASALATLQLLPAW